MKTIVTITAFFVATQLSAQTDSTRKAFTLSAYAEAYYGYDLNKPSDNNRPGFIYSHNRHNEFNLNLGFIKASYNTENVRANLALAAGTYINANYAPEPGVLKNILEANAGVKISKRKNIWVDAGIFPSHIGFESAVSKDCWTLTRSILAENSPYYEAGAKLSYTSDNGEWLISAMALNGWQRIKRVDGNSLMSWGTQIQCKPVSTVTLNYSNFIGTDKPDSARQLRIFHNLYGIFTLSDKLGLTLGFDFGTEEKTPGQSGSNSWYSPVAIVKYAINNKWSVSARGEYYADPDQVIIGTGTEHGFKTISYSLNIDHSPVNNVLLRLEARAFTSKDAVFAKDNGSSKTNNFITSSIAVSF